MNPYSTLGPGAEDTLAGTAGSVVFSTDLMQASLLENYGLEVRDFIVLSFLADRGPMDVMQLSRLIDVDRNEITTSVERLADAGLVMRPAGARHTEQSYVILSSEGSEVASLISEQTENSA